MNKKCNHKNHGYIQKLRCVICKKCRKIIHYGFIEDLEDEQTRSI